MRKLLNRDEDEMTGKSGIGEKEFNEFGQSAGRDELLTIEDFPDAFKPAAGAALISTYTNDCASPQPAAHIAPMIAHRLVHGMQRANNLVVRKHHLH